ncbi:MAG: hypothetical protein JNM70_04195 [Anaerolineae bacterium]|nr:hypothetical protein [Anaerolineae bacterium]
MWIFIGFTVFGIVSILSSSYEWKWWWRFGLNRGIYNLSSIGDNNARRFYWLVGVAMLGLGVGLITKELFNIDTGFVFLLSFPLSLFIGLVIYSARGNQSIKKLFFPDK